MRCSGRQFVEQGGWVLPTAGASCGHSKPRAAWATGVVCDRGTTVLLSGAAARALVPFGAAASRVVRATMVLSVLGDAMC